MVAPRRVIALPTDAEQRQRLLEISRSRTEPTNRVERARIILAYLQNPSAYAVARTIRVTQHIGRFTFTFTPTHGSWLNLIEAFFSKLARSVLRHIRVSSKHQLEERLMAFIADVNREPVVHTWRYKIDNAA